MTSAINPNDIDGTYPIAGQDNNSQGFRDNFTNTKTNFQYAANEITDLQTNVVLKAALTGTVLDNDMGGSPLSNANISDFSAVAAILGTLSGTVTINYVAGHYQTVTTGGSIDAVNLVGQGRIDIAGADLGSALQGIARGVNIKIIGGLVQNFPWAMTTDPKKNIKTPADLKGKTIGIIGFGSGSYPFTKAWLAGNGMKETDVKLVAVGGSIAPATVALERGDVDALAFFLSAYAATEFTGTKYNYLPNPAALTGVRSLSWVVNADRYNADPEVFERFLRGAFKGLIYSTQNTKSATTLGYTEIPAALAGQTLASRLDSGTFQLKAWLATATPTSGTPVSWNYLGDVPLGDWTKSQAYTRAAGTTVTAISRARYFDSKVLKNANSFDRKPIVAAADRAK